MRTTKSLCLVLASACLLILPGCNVHEEKSANGDDKNVSIETPVGDLHVGNDVDVRDAGLSVYPGAQLKPNLHQRLRPQSRRRRVHFHRFARQNYRVLPEGTQEIRQRSRLPHGEGWQQRQRSLR